MMYIHVYEFCSIGNEAMIYYSNEIRREIYLYQFQVIKSNTTLMCFISQCFQFNI